MKKLIFSLIVGSFSLATGVSASAQENLLANKDIHALGEAKKWTSKSGQEYTFITDDLAKLVTEPTNTSNVFLFPEDSDGAWDTPENLAIGIQGFYVDLGSSQSIGLVSTTWEGAAANNYDIYVTDVQPTVEVLKTEPTYSAKGLGQYTDNTAVMPDNTKGRYLVFQATDATNWRWGVKIRSISATAPADDVLTTFKVSPRIVRANTETPVNLTILNQFGLDMQASDVKITVSDNAIYSGGNLTVISGDSATFTATSGDATLTATVYVATAPKVPESILIRTPIYTNANPEYNETAVFTLKYNGGAIDLGELKFEDDLVARQFGDARCVFFSNSQTTGAWDGNINPAANSYRNLCLDVFSTLDVDCTIEFESVENLETGTTHPFTLKAGQWNSISVDVAGATKLGNLSIRFTEENMADILLSNIYFSPTEVIEKIPTRLQINLDDNSMWVNDEKSFSYTVYDQYDMILPTDTEPVFTITDNAYIDDNNKIVAQEGGIATLTVEVGDLSESVKIYVADIEDYCLGNAKATADRVENSDITDLFDGGKELKSDGEQFKFTDNDMEQAGENEHWAIIDLQAEYDLQRIYIHWEGAYSNNFDVLVGGNDAFENIDNETDETNLHTVYEFRGDKGGDSLIDNIYGEGLEGVRYIKIHSRSNATGYGCKIWDLKAYGTLSYPDKLVAVGEVEPHSWHPLDITIEGLVTLPEGLSKDDIEVSIEPVGVEKDFRTTELTQQNSGLRSWHWAVYQGIIGEGSTMTASDGRTVNEVKCDGFLLSNPMVSLDETTGNTYDVTVVADCSGLYTLRFKGLNGTVFVHDNAYFSDLELPLTIYPDFGHKYSYSAGESSIENDGFNINGYFVNGNTEIVYYEQEMDNLANALVYFPGIYDADFYFYIEGQEEMEQEEETIPELRAKRRAAAELPEEYALYTKIENDRADLSALKNGGLLNLVIAKNGAVTPLLQDNNSESQITFSTTNTPGNTTTGLETVGNADERIVEVYNLQGIRVAADASALENLPAGLYIVGGKKIIKR